MQHAVADHHVESAVPEGRPKQVHLAKPQIVDPVRGAKRLTQP
jgi:hypothetical protein